LKQETEDLSVPCFGYPKTFKPDSSIRNPLSRLEFGWSGSDINRDWDFGIMIPIPVQFRLGDLDWPRSGFGILISNAPMEGDWKIILSFSRIPNK